MARHPHADLIHAFAEGAEIECLSGKTWVPVNYPAFYANETYRIKPKEPEWYENIPKHGVLCWVSDDHKTRRLRQIIKFDFPLHGFVSAGGEAGWRYATPLTDDEIRVFLRGE